MDTKMTKPAICNTTDKRCEACACTACARGQNAEAKRRANNRDALALLKALARRIKEGEPAAPVTWGHVGSAADIRERLLQVAMSFALGPDGEEAAARRRLEEALCAGDESASESLFDVM
ncbi:MAG: hypothetical protein IPI49_19935 [Myxococcales bacterium]|nr:hypothetical protein [Myxococcales bacterium]